MPREYHFYVYILQSSSRRALYVGMTNNLRRRVFEHKTHRMEGFTDDYNATRLVYWQSFDEVSKAINREKQLKGWRREKKLWLIGRFNPGWKDLAADWYGNTRSLDLPSLTLGTALGMTDGGEGPKQRPKQ
ncbi:MAG: GIY-YIG nuclease family protein [Terriglobales bacterium]